MRSLGHYAYRWRGRIVLLALGLTVGAAFYAAGIFDEVKPYGFQDPDSESARTYERLEGTTGEQPLPGLLVLVKPGAPVDSDAGQRAIDGAAQDLAGIDGVARVEAPGQAANLVSTDGRAAVVKGFLDSSVDDESEVGEVAEEIFSDREGVTVGGSAVASHQLNTTTEEDLRRIELYAAPILFLLSLLVFRGLVAAMLPLIVGGLSIISTLFALRLLSSVVDIDVFAINIVTALGLGLAIDYSLFMVSRYREELERHGPSGQTLRETMGAVGPMIAFSGLTVACALASLVVFPQRFLYSIGIGGALVALLSAVVVLAVLPALLSLLGERVNALAPPGLQRRDDGNRWYRFARGVMRHPLPVATIAAGLMIVAGLPFLRVELTRADSQVLPANASAHEVDRTIGQRFVANPSDSLLIVREKTQSPEADQEAQAAADELTASPAVTSVSSERPLDGLVRIDAQLAVRPYSDEALDAVEDARGANWGSAVLVSGPSAELVDQRDSLSEHLPFAIAIAVLSTMLILLLMTRSIALPIVALLMNTLTVGVAFGALVFIFQDGRFEETLDYMSQSALDTSMPILLFALAFGLSTDYGVFLLQRISEERPRAEDDADAIARGMARSGRPITAAALLFAVAMGAFVFSDLIFLKEVAVGTAIAVLVDATIVRALLFPAILRLLGGWAWWAPGPLRHRTRLG